MSKAIGIFMLVAIFGGMAMFFARLIGWWDVAKVFACEAVALAWITGAVALLTRRSK